MSFWVSVYFQGLYLLVSGSVVVHHPQRKLKVLCRFMMVRMLLGGRKLVLGKQLNIKSAWKKDGNRGFGGKKRDSLS